MNEADWSFQYQITRRNKYRTTAEDWVKTQHLHTCAQVDWSTEHQIAIKSEQSVRHIHRNHCKKAAMCFFASDSMKFGSSKLAELLLFGLIAFWERTFCMPAKLTGSSLCTMFTSYFPLKEQLPGRNWGGFVPAVRSTLATTLVRQEAALIKLFVFLRGFLLPGLTVQSSNPDQEQLNKRQ